MKLDFGKTLILAPHPDDAEFGLGGTISRLVENQTDISVVVFSDCEKSLPEGFESGSILREMFESLALLRIPRENIYTLNYEVRKFSYFRQEILEDLVKLNKIIQPDTVFIPSSSDIHQDHSVIHQEGSRAFKYSNLLGYEMPWNNFQFNSLFYVELSDWHLESKIKALKTYSTQQFRPYSSEDFIRSLATLRGAQINRKYAESFEIVRIKSLLS